MQCAEQCARPESGRGDDLICALDVGTTGVKTALFDPAEGAVFSAYEEHRPLFPSATRVEQDPEVLSRAIHRTVRAAAEAAADHGKRIAAVAVTSARATFVPASADGEPLGPFIIWQDHRSAEICEEIAARIGEDRYFDTTGLRLEPVASASKAAWLQRHEPERWRDTERLISAQEFGLTALGAERPPCHASMAAYFGVLDLRRRHWDVDLLECFGLRLDQLPRVVEDSTVVGEVTAAAAARTRLPEGTPLVVTPSDWACCQLASLGREQAQAVAYIGTAGAMAVPVAQPTLDPTHRLTCLPGALPGTYSIEGLLVSGGAAYRWFRDTCASAELEHEHQGGESAYAVLEREAADVPPGSNGLLMMPTLMGGGPPAWDADLRGAFVGINLATTRGAMARAVMEGVSLEIARVIESAEELTGEIGRVTITGQPAGSQLWSQIQADVYGAEVQTVAPNDPTMAGAAICASAAVGLHDDVEGARAAFVRGARKWAPDPDARERHRELRAIYADLVDALSRSQVSQRLRSLAGPPNPIAEPGV